MSCGDVSRRIDIFRFSLRFLACRPRNRSNSTSRYEAPRPFSCVLPATGCTPLCSGDTRGTFPGRAAGPPSGGRACSRTRCSRAPDRRCRPRDVLGTKPAEGFGVGVTTRYMKRPKTMKTITCQKNQITTAPANGETSLALPVFGYLLAILTNDNQIANSTSIAKTMAVIISLLKPPSF
jgi:hypothetical protein